MGLPHRQRSQAAVKLLHTDLTGHFAIASQEVIRLNRFLRQLGLIALLLDSASFEDPTGLETTE